jgi:hypothetical protein
MKAMPTETVFALEYLIADLADALQMNRTFSGTRSNEIAELIIEDFPHLSIEDIALCFKNLKKGNYGNLYQTLNSQIIIECLRKYDIQRLEVIEEIHIKQKNETDKANDLINASEMFKAIREELEEPKKSSEADYEAYRKQFYTQKIKGDGM